MFKHIAGILLSISIGINILLLKKTIDIEHAVNSLQDRLDKLNNYSEYTFSPLPSFPCSPLISSTIDRIELPKLDLD